MRSDLTRAVDRFFRKVEKRFPVASDDKKKLVSAITETRSFKPRQMIVNRGELLDRSCLLVSGFACRYKDLADGRRQILELHVAGDFVDLHSFHLKRLEHNIAAIGPAETAFVPHDNLHDIARDSPRLAHALWFTMALDAAVHREWIMSVGRRTAIARVAHLLCEMYFRLEAVGLVDSYHFSLPLTQVDLADATGLTPVHVNRMIQDLRREGLISLRNGDIIIHNLPRLTDVADFSTDYLYLKL